MVRDMQPHEINYVIAHSNCPDGWGAAWCVWRDNPNCKFFFASYGSEKLPEVDGKNVLMVDFAYKDPNFINELNRRANKMLILDHHKTAVENLDGKIDCDYVFDMGRSGARMAWDFMNPGYEAPFMIRCIEDRDIWKWNVHNSKEFLASMDSWELSFENLDWINDLDGSESQLQAFMGEGRAILRFKKKLVEIAAKKAVPVRILAPDGSEYNAMSVNDSSPVIVSDLCHHLLRTNIHGFDIAIAWSMFIDSGKSIVSLRSEGETDVSAIAKLFGGGGHKNAAGFETLQNPRSIFIPIPFEENAI
jgi:hypothetical protein